MSSYAYTLTFLLAVVGLVGCVGRFDYNLVLALGWIYLTDKNIAFSTSLAVHNLLDSFMCWLLGQ